MRTLLIIIVVLYSLASEAVGQVNQFRSNGSTTKSAKENKMRLLSWWNNNQSIGQKKLIDTVKFELTTEITVSGQLPVQYHMYGQTAEGGIVQFELKIIIGKNDVELVYYNFIHKATPGVKHKDGGQVFLDKPEKGSHIFAKTWKAYQEQTMTGVREMEKEIYKIVR